MSQISLESTISQAFYQKIPLVNCQAVNPCDFELKKVPSDTIQLIINQTRPFSVNIFNYDSPISTHYLSFRKQKACSQQKQSPQTSIQMLKDTQYIQDTIQNSSLITTRSKTPRITSKLIHQQQDDVKINNFIPDWIIDRRDFKRLYFEGKVSKHMEIAQMFSVCYQNRSSEQNLQISKFLQQTQPFCNINSDILNKMIQKMSSLLIPSNFQIQNQKIKPDYIGFIISGQIQQTCAFTNKQIIKSESDIINRDQNVLIKSLSNCILLTINKNQFDQIISDFWKNHRLDFITLLQRNSVSGLSQLDSQQLVSLLSNSKLNIYFQKEKVLQIEQKIDKVQICYQGLFKSNKIHRQILQNQWPSQNNKKEVRKVYIKSSESSFFKEGESWTINDIGRVSQIEVITESILALAVEIEEDAFKSFSEDIIQPQSPHKQTYCLTNIKRKQQENKKDKQIRNDIIKLMEINKFSSLKRKRIIQALKSTLNQSL